MGSSGTAVFGGYVQQREKSSQWVGYQRYVTIADMAVNASIVAAGVHYFVNLLARPSWEVEPADESAEAEAAAELVEECLHGLTQPWSRVVRRAATFRFYGFGVQEWTAKRREDGRVGLASIEPRPQHTIERWAVGPSGAVEGVWQRHPETGAEQGIPRRKLLYLVDDTLSDSPEGVGIFRHLAEPWERLKVYFDLEKRAFERDLRGTPVGRVPYTLLRDAVKDGAISAEDAASITRAMEDFVKLQVKRSDTAITLDSIPYYSQAADGAKVAGTPQWGLELLQGGAAGMGEVAAAITRTQTEMARVLTAEHLMMGESSGNRALSEDKSRALYLVSNAVLGDIVAGVNHDVVPNICLLNNIPEKYYPRCVAEDVAFQSAEMVASTLAKMAQAGAVLAPDDPVVADVRALMGVAEPLPVPPELAGFPGGKPPPSAGAPEIDPETGEPIAKFDPSQPRDQIGRWTATGGTGGVSSNGAAGALLAANADPKATIEGVLASLSPQQREAVDEARAGLAAGTPTRDQYRQADGTYTPEREALHEEIIAGILTPEAVAAATPPEGVPPEFVLTGGRPAAGKTSALRAGGIEAGPPKYVYLSADEIQEKLPGYSGARAGLFNPEAQDIADKVETMARGLGVNLTFDATMKTQSSAAARVAAFKAAGYDVSGYFVHTAPEVSAVRSVQRFMSTGRFVPPEISFNSRSNEATFDALTPEFRRWAIFDNNGDAPRLVARSG
jgi:predicted ABC-type ATPase